MTKLDRPLCKCGEADPQRFYPSTPNICRRCHNRRQNEHNQAARKRNREQGLCRCGKSPVEGRTRCARCLEQKGRGGRAARQAQRVRQQAAKDRPHKSCQLACYRRVSIAWSYARRNEDFERWLREQVDALQHGREPGGDGEGRARG